MWVLPFGSRVAVQFLQVVKAKATPVKATTGKQQQSIIDSKRAYNINILMGSKIKIPVSCLQRSILMSFFNFLFYNINILMGSKIKIPVGCQQIQSASGPQ